MILAPQRYATATKTNKVRPVFRKKGPIDLETEQIRPSKIGLQCFGTMQMVSISDGPPEHARTMQE